VAGFGSKLLWIELARRLELKGGWREAYTPEEAAVRLVTDPHAPSMFRAVATPSNMEAFARAFGCRAGDPMAREADGRIVIW
jgi:putative endopeptidase